MLEFFFDGIGRIGIDSNSCESLISFRQAENEYEKAGVLAGFLSSPGEWTISRVMPPTPKSRASKFWVRRHLPTAQTFVNEEFYRSGGMVNYLGEWHTHPCKNPTPSWFDKRMLTDLLENSTMDIDFLIGLIVGQEGSGCCWTQQLTPTGRIITNQPQRFTFPNLSASGAL